MIVLASDWLCLALLLCIAAWFAGRWMAFTLPLAVFLAAIAVYVPTGSPRFTKPPPGDYQVMGADIEVGVAIYVLLKDKSEAAVYYKLPYSNGQAGSLQNAMDGEGRVKAKVVDGEGGVVYDGEPPDTGIQPKPREQPSVTLP